MKLILRLRHEAMSNLTTVWLIRCDGKDPTALVGLMHGVMNPKAAEELAAFMEKAGAKIERSVFEGERGDEPRPETTVAKQQELAAEQRTLFEEQR